MNRKVRYFSLLIVVVLLAMMIASPVLAQTPTAAPWRLNVNRDFGYGGGADIKGLFTLSVIGQEDITSVTYLIDEKEMAVVSEDPFKFQFNTSQYPYGWHDLTAEVTNLAGEKFVTPARHLNFVTSEMESETMKKMILPLFGLILGVMLIVGVVQFVLMRKRNPNGVPAGTKRNYGYAGGSICRKCGRPTPRHIWGFNIGIGKLDRCENCGRWSVMQGVPLGILRTAEEAEKASETSQSTISEKSEDEKLRELIDKSKYE
jgi:hypothetical protein